jgi:MFS transporter, PAT family, beta-lactamase induction signal transducer AmpG
VVDPVSDPWMMALVAFLVAFFSATQDIVIDAYRREALPEKFIGLGNSIAITGYRLGMILSGAVALMLADMMTWGDVYKIMAVLMVIGVLGTFLAQEKELQFAPPKSLIESVWLPFQEFFQQSGSILILLFIILYKAGDNMAAQMNVTFILQQGYSKTEYAAIAKGMGVIATIIGGFIGGFTLVRLGVRKSLLVFGILQGLSTALFAMLYGVEHSLSLLTFVIAVENLASGMGTAAFVTYMAGLTSVRFTATQYALLSSLAAFSGSFLAAPTGILVESVGWVQFYMVCAMVAVPGLVVLLLIDRLDTKKV